MMFQIVLLLIFLAASTFAQSPPRPEFHPYIGRKIQTYMGPTAVKHPYADNREMKYYPQDKYNCEPIFAMVDKNSWDKTVDLECVAFPYVYDDKQKNEVDRLVELRRSECFLSIIARCELDDKKVWRLKSEPIAELSDCKRLVDSKKRKEDAAKQCQIQTSLEYKLEQKKIKDAVEQKKQAETQNKLDQKNSVGNKLYENSVYDLGVETQGRYSLGLGYAFGDIKKSDSIGAMYPFLQVAGTKNSVESYSLGLRVWSVYMLSVNYHMAYEKIVNGRDRMGLEAGIGFLAFTPFLGYSTDFNGDHNVRVGLRIILNSAYFN